MRKLLCLVILAGLGLGALVHGDVPAEKKPADPSVPQLVEQLGHSDFRKRDEAAKILEGLGPRILPELRKARSNSDPEVRRRLDDLIPTLETIAVLTPKRVTLKMAKKPLKQIMDEVTRQTGYKTQFWGGNEQQLYNFDFDNVTFWEAIDKICETTGLLIQQGYGDDQMHFQFQDSYVPYVFRDGPFRFQATGFQYQRNIDFATLPRTPAPARRNEYLTFSFNVYTEPKLPLLGAGQVKLTEVYDDQKNSMLPVANNGEQFNQWQGRQYYRYGNGYRSYFTQTQVNLVKTSDRAKVVKLLRGTIPITLLAEQKPEIVSDNILKAKGTKVKLGSTSISIDEVTATPAKQYEIKLSITEDGKENDYTWMNSLYQRVELQDAKGEKYQFNGTSMGSNGAGTATLGLTCTAPGNVKVGPPAKLVYYTWNTIQHQVAFEFKDLPLP